MKGGDRVWKREKGGRGREKRQPGLVERAEESGKKAKNTHLFFEQLLIAQERLLPYVPSITHFV
jgi:hypothetical protein